MDKVLAPGAGVEFEIRAQDMTAQVTIRAGAVAVSWGGTEVRLGLPAAVEAAPARAAPAPPAEPPPPTRRSPAQEPAADVEVHTPPPTAGREFTFGE